MTDNVSFGSLVIVIVSALITPIILTKLRLKAIPVVVAEILIGLVIGKSGFNWIHAGSLISALSSLGLIFLMFLSGVEIDFSVFTNTKRNKLPNGRLEPNRVLISSLVFVFIFAVSYLLSWGLYLGGFTTDVFFMTLVISTISLGVVMPTLKESKIVKTGIGQTILLITVIADLVTMILLAVFVSLKQGEGNLWLIIILFLAGLVLYLIGRFFRHRTFFESLTTGTIQIGTRSVFALIIFLVGLSQKIGVETILGAFIAGVLVSLLSPNKELVKQLDSFGYGFLIPIFFVMVGVDLNIWPLLTNPSILILIPLLLLSLLLSKLIPALILKRWYDWPTVLGSGFLITSTLSLVVAAAKVGEQIKIITSQTASALILLAIVTCILTPALYKRIFPFHQVSSAKRRLVLIGANSLTLPLANEMDSNRYEVSVYHKKGENIQVERQANFTLKPISSYMLEEMIDEDLFTADILVAATADENDNVRLAEIAKNQDVPHIVARVETPKYSEYLREREIHVVSSFFSTKAMMRVMIESPDVATLFTTEEKGLFQIEFNNRKYHQKSLRALPFLGDAIIVRIIRKQESIVPHGNTQLLIGDHLIVTGNQTSVQKLQEELNLD
ncbi:cation:proton antiporter [Pullulanibacillus sp. KACC 23026]|uniref:monovalent cation:proton antiporter family protein n=1 Tax=Pullulanibacillus sp. KACC 23026 TaxID=3028315 RepID=UPI0023B14BF0|nr:cation:proton antiporter [Pullulanibacillus sp. KACC 23026]WEG11019.1 cation:proton antiporter [Pullulanibacillus sp. KACC 23026]